MAIYSPKFNIDKFELRRDVDYYSTLEQYGKISDAVNTTASQLNWVAQLLGWSGKEYWSSFNHTVSQKRQLLTGTYGIYNKYVLPEVVEVRNWNNSVVIKSTPHVKEGQEAYVGNFSYTIRTVKTEGENLVLGFDDLEKTDFYADFSNNFQLRLVSPSAIPSPFVRPDVGVSCDRKFLCKVEGGAITLFPDFDSEKKLPYRFNTLYPGSRYHFDLPIRLKVAEDLYIDPTYNFNSESWYIDVPCETEGYGLGVTTTLEYGSASLPIYLSPWSDPSDWVDDNKILYFKGVWGDKGGPLPFHFTFDALSLHGFDETKSIYFAPLERSLSFDNLLNFVYEKRAVVDSYPPPVIEGAQLWWNHVSKKLLAHPGRRAFCDPWVEIEYPEGIVENVSPLQTFSNVAAFRAYNLESLGEGDVVLINNCSGLDKTDNILGLTSTTPLSSTSAKVKLIKLREEGWLALEFDYSTVAQFNTDNSKLPVDVKVNVLNANGLTETGSQYSVANLKITVSGSYKASLVKYDTGTKWYLIPPSELKYIGNTRLYESSLNYSNPVEGELVWDFSNPDPSTRDAYVYYNAWYNVNTGATPFTPVQVVNYGTILVYCDGVLLTSGQPYVTDDYQILYSSASGEFTFNYKPFNYSSSVKPPEITISDSLTTSYVFDISKLVFSGLQYYVTPNVQDGETLLRLWKSQHLFCRDDDSAYSRLNYPNSLVADENTGPLSTNWDRYFVRLPPSYQRNGEQWQKVSLICQDFGYWGSSPLPEDMGCPAKESDPEIYEEVYLFKKQTRSYSFLYSEPYLYSNAVPSYQINSDYDNAEVVLDLTGYNNLFSNSDIISYEPLHERRANTDLPVGKGYGDWDGDYYRVDECFYLNGHLINDISEGVLDPVTPPVWDYSLYKMPSTCVLDEESGTVDSNHFKIGYAFFVADLSAAEEAVFSFG